MNEDLKQKIWATINALEDANERPTGKVERLFWNVVTPLLAEDGYNVTLEVLGGDDPFDLVASKGPDEHHQPQTIGVQFKYSRKPIQVDSVYHLLGAASLGKVSRAILISNAGFTRRALELVRAQAPVDVQLLGTAHLRDWLMRVSQSQEQGVAAQIREMLRATSRAFAMMVARDPEALKHIEWRDVERMLAEVFSGLGFHVELTPPTKDGGKDIVLQFGVAANKVSYIVEVKHWRAGSKVTGKPLREFLDVIIREDREGGLFLSTFGYSRNAFEQLTEIERRRLKFGSQTKVVALCNSFVKAEAGLWSPPEDLSDVLYETTE